MPLCGNAYKISVTGLAFCVIWHSKHSADWLAALASPYPASPDFPRKRGQNKTPRNTLFISISTVSTGYSAPSKRGERWWRQPPKGECISSPARAVVRFSCRQRQYKKWRQRRRTSPAQRYFIPSKGGALNPPVRRSRSQAEPWQPRAERPGGCLNPHARKGVSTYGNTGKHRHGPSSAPISSVPQRSRGADRYTLQ